MKKRLTILKSVIALCFFIMAQSGFSQNEYRYTKFWQIPFPPYYYENYSSAFLSVRIDGVEVKNNYTEIGVFCGDEVRGSGILFPVNKTDGIIYVAAPSVYGKYGDNFTFKLYDHEKEEVLKCKSVTSLQFVNPDISFGTVDDPIIIDFESSYVAQVGDNKFETLAEALNAVESSDDVITILKDTQGPGLVIDKDVTIDFNGKTYSFTEGVGSGTLTSNGFQILQGNTVVLKNGTLNVNADDADEFYILVQNYANLTVKDMNLDGTNLDKWSATDGDSYVLSNNSGNVSITGNTIIKANDQGDKAFAFDACKYASYDAPVVTLGNDVTINGRVELTGGQLYHNTEGVEAVVKKSFKGNAGVWGTISVPMESADIPTAEAGIHDLYRYDEAEAQWEYYTGSGASNPYTKLDLGHGYLYANTNDIDLAFEGELNVNSVVRELSCSHSTLPGFNLVGNPFAHEISKANLTTEGDLTTGFYIVNANGALEARTDETKIAPMEAFMVKATQAGNMTINKDASAKRTVSDNSYIAVNVANSQYSDVAYVSFGEGMGLDKIAHRNNDVPMVYIPVDGTEYAIAMMSNDVTEIPVSFKAATIGEYTIGAETQNCEYAMMTLVDRFTGVETNLLIEDYTFIAKSNDSAERFIIKLAMANGNDGDNENFAFINNGMMYIYNIEGQGVVSVYDVTGRPVAEYNVETSANISTAEFAAGVYIIRMSDENGVKVQKIVVE